ncbi:RNA polymerase III subunit [Heterostelium album PN500]|uniref:DNA-directed RNA polymerase III subunit RPC6 n=1 Tax=Heterostelium pallidum (strain ATCC 26659 / Pp 5 / PN500) TaxID=670386 RepID=D3BNC7_HETP5|nr:RNA polymerase III subunit [Heterostelium album PN500]EFA76787.1 RNA polymerase III subunit [Heterostelium album PN500]|eukprot:XP_020428919.1 RNA polymerase III subunit [Heterostelium album PN500]
MSAEVEDKFLELCSKHPTGLSQARLESDLGYPINEALLVINKLVKEGRIKFIQNSDGSTSYKEVTNLEEQSKIRGLTADDMLVYQLIEQSNDKGTWTKEIRTQTNLQQTQVTKILKVLETRNLIKAVKTINMDINIINDRKAIAGRKKVYMAYNVEPSREVTGGSLYGGSQSLDEELISAMKLSCNSFISNKGAADLTEIMNYMKKTGEQDLTMEDIQTLVNSLIYDGLIEEMRDTRSTNMYGRRMGVIYKPTKTIIPENHFTKMPCGVCPVFSLCADEGEITPKKCVYFQQWLNQEDLEF